MADQYAFLRPEQRAIARLLAERIREKGDTDACLPVIALLAPGFGKELAWQHAAVVLRRAGLIDAVMVFTPRTNLCQQAETNWWHRDSKGNEHGYRLLYDDPRPGTYTWPDGNQMPLYEPPAFGYVTTYAALVTNESPHRRVAESHAGRLLIVTDEAAALGGTGVSEEDERTATHAAQAIQRLSSCAAGMLLLTGAPRRSDGRRLVLCEDRYRQEADGWHLEADIRGPYTVGVTRGYLRPIHAHYIDQTGDEYVGKDEPQQVSVSEDQSLVRDALRTKDVYRAIINRTVRQLSGLRETFGMPFTAGIACMDKDHARAVVDDARSFAPNLRVEIALSSDLRDSRRVLKAARAGEVDLLIFVRQAFIGFDAPMMAVLGLLTHWRDDSFLIQLVGRVLRIWDKLPVADQWAYVVTLDDQRAVDFFKGMREDAERGLRERTEGAPPSPPGPSREIHNWRLTGERVEDMEGEVEGGAWMVAVAQRHGLAIQPRKLAAILKEVRGGPSTETVQASDLVPGEALTDKEHVQRHLAGAEANMKSLAGQLAGRPGNSRPYGEIIKDLKNELTERSYHPDHCTRNVGRARARLGESVKMCQKAGARVRAQ